MGIKNINLEYERKILNLLDISYKGLKWCELGDQFVVSDTGKISGIAKDHYLSLDVDHISIDINGNNGAFPLDLDFPVPFIFIDQFDVVTNYGMSEHINDQYRVFKNTHDMCKQHGIMIHHVPLVGTYPGHCRYYYTQGFMNELADRCGYGVINTEILDDSDHKNIKKLVGVTFLKIEDREFITENEFYDIDGLEDTGDLTYSGDYTRRKIGLIKRIGRLLK